MKPLHSLILWSFAPALGACAAGGMGMDPKIYTPSEVVSTADALRGQTVSVRGYLILEDEAHGLWDSKEAREYIRSHQPDPDDAAWKRCITAYYSRSGAQAIGREHPRNLVAIGRIGVANADDSIDFGACSDVSITIEDVVLDRTQNQSR